MSFSNGENGRHVFGTDGVRGKANHFPMTVDMALKLGKAAGKIFKVREGAHKVVIGKDTRLSCYMFENALIAGLCSMGIDTLMVGPMPTPAIAYITRAYRADAGIVISASHNQYYDNGIKFFSSAGYKLPDEWEKEMEELISENDFSKYLPEEDKIGRNHKVRDAYGRYIEFAKATFPKGKTLQKLKISLDCANGAAYKVAPLIFEELDAEVSVIGAFPDGLNINLGYGSMHLENVQKDVIDKHSDVGIALDGDADRVIMIDERAQIVDGDTILAICANDMKQSGTLTNNCVVGTVMANFGFCEAMEKRGITVVQSQVGDRYVIEEMLRCEATLGGEQSGHIIFSDYNTTGDGIVAALQVLRIMMQTESRLSDLASIVNRFPQSIVNVQVSSKPPLEDLKKVQLSIKEVEKLLGTNGRVLVRYSGTEMICRVMVEGKEPKAVYAYANQIASAIQEELGG